MRNLKRALSLTLASVMLLGMMIVGTSALSFNDADDISNVTAATVLQELGVMQGSGGNFAPNETVTRGQMAILICKMLYGDKLNVSQFSGTTQYNDVPANAYYTGYVNLATQLGILSGYGDGNFGPGDPITTAQAALMLSRALGWFQAGELSGQGWANNALTAMSKATQINLFGNLKLETNTALSRDNVCEMVFNAMTKTTPVMYNDRWGVYYTDSDNVLAGTKFDYTNTLGYENYDLVYKDNGKDDFERPSTEWGTGTFSGSTDNKGDLVASNVTIRNSFIKSADEPEVTYTKKVEGQDIYSDMGKPDIGDITYYVNGVLTAVPASFQLKNGCDIEIGAKGSALEVYRDDDTNDVTIIRIDTYLVKASADYSSNNEELSVIAYGVTLDDTKISNDDVAVSQFKKDDLILVTGVKTTSNRLEIKTAELADKVEDVTVRAYNATKDYVTAGGTKYEYNVNVNYDPDGVIDNYNLQKTAYTMVLDKAGYVIGVEKYSDEVTLDDILFVKDAAKNGFDWRAKVVFMDGNEKTVTIAGTQKVGGSDYEDITYTADNQVKNGVALANDGELNKNRFYEFNEKSNGEYELKDLASVADNASPAAGERQGKVSAIPGQKNIDGDRARPILISTGPATYLAKSATDNTIFIADDEVFTGGKNAPDVTNGDVYYLLGTNSNANYLLAVYTPQEGVSVSSTSDWVYVLAAKGEGKENDKTFNVYDVIKDGARNKDFDAKGEVTNTGLYEIKSTEDGFPKLEAGNRITSAKVDVLDYYSGVSSTNITYKPGSVEAGIGMKVNSDTVVYEVDVPDKEVYIRDVSSVEGVEEGVYDVYAIFVSKSDDTVKTLWLVKTGEIPGTTSRAVTGITNQAVSSSTTNPATTFSVTPNVATAAGGTTVTLTVTLSAAVPATKQVTVDFTTPAISDVVFAAGETSKTTTFTMPESAVTIAATATEAAAPAPKNVLGDIAKSSTAAGVSIKSITVKSGTTTIAKDAEMAAGDYTLEVVLNAASSIAAPVKVTLSGDNITAKGTATAASTPSWGSGTNTATVMNIDANSNIAEANVITYTFTVAAATGSTNTTITPVITITTTGANAKLEATVTFTGTPTWAENDTVTFTSTGGTTNLNITAAVGDDNATFTCTGAPSGYTATFADGKLTLTATGKANVSTSPFGTITAAVSNANDSTLTSGTVGTPTWTPGVAAST